MNKISLKHKLRGLIFLGITPIIILPISCANTKNYEDYSKEFADKSDKEVVDGIESKHIQAAINDKFKSTNEWTENYKKQITELQQDPSFVKIEIFGAIVKYATEPNKPWKLNGEPFIVGGEIIKRQKNNDEMEVVIKVLEITKNQATRSDSWEMTIKTTVVLPEK